MYDLGKWLLGKVGEGMTRRIWKTVFVVAAMLGIIGLALLMLWGTQTPKETGGLITRPFDELLPSRDNIAAEWLGGDSSSVTLDARGFLEGRSALYHKRIGSTHSGGRDYFYFTTFFVYRFSDASSAEAYFGSEVNKIISEGGYQEVAIPDVFAAIYDYGTADEGFSWGHRQNLVFGVYVYNNAVFEADKELIEFTNLLIDRIA
jgi:hypothetical protein